MSTVARNSIHTYFDVCPESPDGRHLCWFRFDNPLLTNGTVMLGARDGSSAIAVQRCTGDPHEAARQGWLDDAHIYFSAAGQVHIADLAGRIVRSIPGAIDTIHQGSRRGLLHSAAWRKAGGNPDGEACWRLDLDDGRLTRLLDRATAFHLLATQLDLTGVPEECLTFKHTKWAPDGRRWLVVFTNEGSWRTHKGQPRVKVLLQANADGSGLHVVGSFGHHPNWLPDSSGIYAFAADQQHRLLRWDVTGGEATVFATLPTEGHPSVSPDGRLVVTDGYDYRAGTGRVVCQDLASGRSATLCSFAWPQVDWQVHHPPHRLCHAHPVWSRDGRRIYINVPVGDAPELRVIEPPDEARRTNEK